ncbi:protein of unknown function [Aminobacter niigataensis]|nr:protein of unknown function [Aminobacter niigataensis]
MSGRRSASRRRRRRSGWRRWRGNARSRNARTRYGEMRRSVVLARLRDGLSCGPAGFDAGSDRPGGGAIAQIGAGRAILCRWIKLFGKGASVVRRFKPPDHAARPM